MSIEAHLRRTIGERLVQLDREQLAELLDLLITQAHARAVDDERKKLLEELELEQQLHADMADPQLDASAGEDYMGLAQDEL